MFFGISISWFSLLFKLRVDKTLDVVVLFAKLFVLVVVEFFLADSDMFFLSLVAAFCCELAAEEFGGVVWVDVVVDEETAILTKFVFVDGVCIFELLTNFLMRVCCCWVIEDGLFVLEDFAFDDVAVICLVSSLSFKMNLKNLT